LAERATGGDWLNRDHQRIQPASKARLALDPIGGRRIKGRASGTLRLPVPDDPYSYSGPRRSLRSAAPGLIGWQGSMDGMIVLSRG
jgi:hypothetical protein